MNLSKKQIEEAENLALKIGELINGKDANVSVLALTSVWDVVQKIIKEGNDA